ncbi:MAG: hypothetical protein MZW92_70485 [Comamonadaceae bacterium]|nr:hypothetical protein [Comamonadaceae bacterium]
MLLLERAEPAAGRASTTPAARNRPLSGRRLTGVRARGRLARLPAAAADRLPAAGRAAPQARPGRRRRRSSARASCSWRATASPWPR